ncbi:hypothetical protein SCLCIDRAFT_1217193 [Scleroderma citrinum Foug A]|uniref:Uncharacterized protein n=1 Tax=Scleroderma citrinum Foug A TaxID=1036808 RepID=A0A0C2ZDU7_9AGAM|nr:hypothetical protein SCLCIDRAFT_1217193 [Scleroderma citrinum Foug A]
MSSAKILLLFQGSWSTTFWLQHHEYTRMLMMPTCQHSRFGSLVQCDSADSKSAPLASV